MPIIYLRHMRRGHNGASDALCNWIMDSTPPMVDHGIHGRRWPCLPPYAAAQSPAISLGVTPAPPRPDDTTAHATAARSLVLQELTTVAHLITARFAPGLPSLPTFRPVVRPPPASSVNTAARHIHSEFDTAVPRTDVVAGLLRCVPVDVFRRLQETSNRLHVPFPLDTAFLAAGPGPLRIPVVDATILDAFVSDPHLGIAGTLELFRGQTSLDSHPNKALRPWLYQVHLPTYPDLPLLCSIAEHGIVPPWINPDQRLGARPLPDNYVGTINGSSIVTDKPLKDYYKGRCLIASLSVLEVDPSFHSSAFALVPKKDKPLCVDGRIIHDLSAPAGVSVNDLTD